MTDKFRGSQPRQDFAEGVADFARVWAEAAVNAGDIAHSKRQVFLAYVAEGFSEAQSLELIKHI